MILSTSGWCFSPQNPQHKHTGKCSFQRWTSSFNPGCDFRNLFLYKLLVWDYWFSPTRFRDEFDLLMNEDSGWLYKASGAAFAKEWCVLVGSDWKATSSSSHIERLQRDKLSCFWSVLQVFLLLWGGAGMLRISSMESWWHVMVECVGCESGLPWVSSAMDSLGGLRQATASQPQPPQQQWRGRIILLTHLIGLL